MVRPGCCGTVAGGRQFGRFQKAVGFFVAGIEEMVERSEEMLLC